MHQNQNIIWYICVSLCWLWVNMKLLLVLSTEADFCPCCSTIRNPSQCSISVPVLQYCKSTVVLQSDRKWPPLCLLLRLHGSGCDSVRHHLGGAGHPGLLLPTVAQEPVPGGRSAHPGSGGAVRAGHAGVQQHHQTSVMSFPPSSPDTSVFSP